MVVSSMFSLFYPKVLDKLYLKGLSFGVFSRIENFGLVFNLEYQTCMNSCMYIFLLEFQNKKMEAICYLAYR